jgi:hypothetical protein
MRVMFVIVIVPLLGNCGCREQLISGDGWYSDLEIVDEEGRPLAAELVTEVGQPVVALVSFKPGTPQPEAFPERTVLPPDEWRVRAEVLDANGVEIAQRPPGGFYGEMHDYRWYGVESVDSQDSTKDDRPILIWVSPEQQPPTASEERRNFWGRTLVPPEPGKYRFVIRLYPAANPRHDRDLNPEFGPPITLFEASLVVTEGESFDSRIRSSLKVAEFNPRKYVLKQYKTAR